MTYFELINYLNSIKNKPITSETINYLNNVNIHFTSQKYVRFLNHMVDFVQYRLEKIYSSFLDKTADSYIDSTTLSIEIDVIKNEIQMLIACSKLNIISTSSQSELIASIVKSNNNLVNYISSIFNDDRKEIFLSLLVKEEA